MCFPLANAPSCCAPTEREPNSVTSGYKHLAPLGRNPIASTRCTSNLNSRLPIDSLVRHASRPRTTVSALAQPAPV
jgi:hypothetical protein